MLYIIYNEKRMDTVESRQGVAREAISKRVYR
jgi:hypothetical protein